MIQKRKIMITKKSKPPGQMKPPSVLDQPATTHDEE
jgi:hypothetical protein